MLEMVEGAYCTQSELILFWKELAENQKTKSLNRQRHLIYTDCVLG